MDIMVTNNMRIKCILPDDYNIMIVSANYLKHNTICDPY